mgnify:CR=1 FL=1
MPKSKLSVSHSLGVEEAKARLVRLATETKEKTDGLVEDLEDSWNGDTGNFQFSIMGMKISGKVEVEAAEARLEVDFPLTALPFKGQFEKEILEKAKKLLA